jgi:2-alkenal reductase
MNRKYALLVALLLLPLVVLAGYSLPALNTAAAAPTAGTVFDALEATLGQLYDDVTPSVVNIQVRSAAASLPADYPSLPGTPFDPSTPGEAPSVGGLGSGFVWDRQGHIVTNNHVVDGAQEILVTFYDNTTVPATVVGTDPNSDLAVIKVDLPAEQLQPVTLADSTQVQVGQLAVAIGNPFGLQGSMTVGFVSALGRSLPVSADSASGSTYSIPDIIQTDAPINPGNSGGVLVDDNGYVIGVPTAIESPVQASAGIGFAVPAAIVNKVVPLLITDGSYAYPWLGISGASLNSELAGAMDLDSSQRGVLVVEVVAGGPAGQAGLRSSDGSFESMGRAVPIGGDLIVAIDSQPVTRFEDLVTYLARSSNVGDTVALTILRDGQKMTVDVTLGERPAATS